ncbi:hypothetical protein, partial [Acetobacter pasteurianus]
IAHVSSVKVPVLSPSSIPTIWEEIQDLTGPSLGIFPIASRNCHSKIGFTGKVIINACRLNSDFLGKFTEVQAVVTTGLCSLSGCCQDSFSGTLMRYVHCIATVSLCVGR